MPLLQADAGEHAGQRVGNMVEGIVVVVANDHQPAPVQTRAGSGVARSLDRARRHCRDYAAFGAINALTQEDEGMNGLQNSSRAPGLLLGEDVELPNDSRIGANVVIHSGTQIGSGVTIQDGAIVGKSPHLGPRSSASRERPLAAVLGDGAAVLAGAIVFASARLGQGAIVGDQSHVRERSVVGAGSVIGRGSAVDNDVLIGAGVRIQTNCYLTGHTRIEDHVFVGPGVTMANDNAMARHPPDVPLRGPWLERACRIGAGAVLCPGIRIEREAFVAAGSVVAADVPAQAVVMGIPARHVRDVPEDDLIQHWL